MDEVNLKTKIWNAMHARLVVNGSNSGPLFDVDSETTHRALKIATEITLDFIRAHDNARSGHLIEFGLDKWAIQHSTECFPNLLDCPVHAKVSAWLSNIDGLPVPPGRYQLNEDDLRLTSVNE